MPADEPETPTENRLVEQQRDPRFGDRLIGGEGSVTMLPVDAEEQPISVVGHPGLPTQTPH